MRHRCDEAFSTCFAFAPSMRFNEGGLFPMMKSTKSRSNIAKATKLDHACFAFRSADLYIDTWLDRSRALKKDDFT